MSVAMWALAGSIVPGGDLNGRRAQHVEHVGGVEATGAVALEKLGDCHLTDARGFGWCRHDLPQIEQPLGPEVGFQFEQRGKVAPELLAHVIIDTPKGAVRPAKSRPVPAESAISTIAAVVEPSVLGLTRSTVIRRSYGSPEVVQNPSCTCAVSSSSSGPITSTFR